MSSYAKMEEKLHNFGLTVLFSLFFKFLSIFHRMQAILISFRVYTRSCFFWNRARASYYNFSFGLFIRNKIWQQCSLALPKK